MTGQRIPNEEKDPRIAEDSAETHHEDEPEQEVLMPSSEAQTGAPATVATPVIDFDELDKLEAEASAANQRLADARLTAAQAVESEEPRERQPLATAHSEHDSRVDELSEERATHPEPLAPWIRPSSLEAPTPREGMVQRWIRISSRGVDDPRNVNKSMREGWSPRPMNSMPAGFVMSSGSPGNEQGGHFIVDDLMLCEMPERTYAQRRDYYQGLADQQMEAVNQELEDVEAQTGGPHIQRTHKSSVAHPPRVVGRRVEVADDV